MVNSTLTLWSWRQTVTSLLKVPRNRQGYKFSRRPKNCNYHCRWLVSLSGFYFPLTVDCSITLGERDPSQARQNPKICGCWKCLQAYKLYSGTKGDKVSACFLNRPSKPGLSRKRLYSKQQKDRKLLSANIRWRMMVSIVSNSRHLFWNLLWKSVTERLEAVFSFEMKTHKSRCLHAGDYTCILSIRLCYNQMEIQSILPSGIQKAIELTSHKVSTLE